MDHLIQEQETVAKAAAAEAGHQLTQAGGERRTSNNTSDLHPKPTLRLRLRHLKLTKTRTYGNVDSLSGCLHA